MSIRTVALGILLMTTTALTAAETSLPGRTFPEWFGLQVKTSYDDAADLDAVAAAGARFMRRGCYWAPTEIEPGVYDWSDTDRLVDTAEAAGLRWIAVLYGNPNEELHERDATGGIQTEEGRAGFAAFCAAAAARYAGRGVIWEIWNEPNTQTFWRKKTKQKGDGGNSSIFAQEYVALVQAVVPAMKAADPGCYVVGGSLSNYWSKSYEWTEHCFRMGILDTDIDGWSVHPYGVRSPEEHAAGHELIRGLMRDIHGSELPLLNTERGFAVKQTHEGWSGGSLERAREFQAWHLVRQVVLDAMCDVRLSLWYEFKGDTFGFFNDDGSARPVARACATMVTELDGRTFVERLPTDSEQDYLLAFDRVDGDRLIVAWTAPLAGKAPDAAFPHTIELPLTGDGPWVQVSIDGASSKLLEPRIDLSGSPVFIRAPAP